MKKITFTLLTALGLSTAAFGQANVTIQAPQYDGASSSLSTPSGSTDAVYHRACWLVLQSELTGLASTNSVITAMSLDYTQGNVAPPAAGNITLSLQNTSDIAYTKGTAWPALLTGMTAYYTGPYTLPTSNTFTSVNVTLGSSFTYTGGGIYVAMEWYAPTAANTQWARAQCNSTGLSTTGGVRGVAPSAGPAPTTLSVTNFRPAFGWTAANTNTNEVSVENVYNMGQVSKLDGSAGQFVTAYIRNNSANSLTNVTVSLTATGANPYTTSTVVPSIGSGSILAVTFTSYHPTLDGLSTLSVTTANDQDNTNNMAVGFQNVGCNYIAVTPAASATAFASSAYSGGSAGAIYAFKYTSGPAASSLTAVSMVVPSFTNAGNAGNSAYAVLCDASGTILDQGSPVTFSAGNMDVFLDFPLSAPKALTPNTDYYIGIASTGTNAPYGVLSANNVVLGHYAIPLAGGTPIQANFDYLSLRGNLTYSFLTISASTTNTLLCKSGGGQPSSTTLTATGLDTYTWTPGGAGASITVSAPTNTGTVNYSVIGTHTLSGCKSATAKIAVKTILCTGLADNNSDGYNINVFPNPSVNGKSTVNGLVGTNVITVLNTLGQVVINKTVTEESFELDLSNQASGNYLVKITDSNSQSRIIKLVNQN